MFPVGGCLRAFSFLSRLFYTQGSFLRRDMDGKKEPAMKRCETPLKVEGTAMIRVPRLTEPSPCSMKLV